MKIETKILIGNLIALVLLVNVIYYIYLMFTNDTLFGFLACGFMLLLTVMAKTMVKLYNEKDDQNEN